MVNIATLVLLMFTTNSLGSSLDELRKLDSPFRVNKHNLLWDRAKKSIGLSPKLETLHRELKKLDKLSITLKHLEDKDSDEAKNMAIETKQMYLDILNRYGLKTNQVGVDDGETGHNHVKAKFGDKIEKLWQDAMYSGEYTNAKFSVIGAQHIGIEAVVVVPWCNCGTLKPEQSGGVDLIPSDHTT